MNIIIIDGQGGKLGKEICDRLCVEVNSELITVIGTNSIATANMLKSNISKGATGENALKVACRKADIIIGPIGIVVADSMLGEITPLMATLIGQSDALKLLLPVNRCNNQIIGVKDLTINEMIDELVKKVVNIVEL